MIRTRPIFTGQASASVDGKGLPPSLGRLLTCADALLTGRKVDMPKLFPEEFRRDVLLDDDAVGARSDSSNAE